MPPSWKYALAVGWVVGIFAMSSIPGAITDAVAKPQHSDKVLHLVVFAIGAALWAWATGSPLKGLAIAFLVGLAKEGYQQLIPGRSFELLDVAADAIGSALGSLGAFCYERIRRRQTPR